MATNLRNEIYGYETPLFAPTYGEAPSFYQEIHSKPSASQVEVRGPMYDTEAVATGLPMYLGGTVSQRCASLAETARGN